MGWRDRDYAKWSDEERRRFLGVPARAPEPFGSASGRTVLRPGVGLAVAVSATLFALGQLPRSHPILPALHINLPSIHRSRNPTAIERASIGSIHLPARAARGSFLTITGQIPSGEAGTVSIEGAYVRPPWHLLAAVPSHGQSYTARIHLNRTGLLHLRVTYPDGGRSVGKMKVIR